MDVSQLSTVAVMSEFAGVGAPKIVRMSVALVDRTDPATAVSAAQEAVDALLAADLSALSEDALLEVLRGTERLRRRLAAVDHTQILEVETRGLPAANCVRTIGQFLRLLLRLDPAEAAGRLRAAEAAGTRRTLTGQVLAPAYPQVAAAQAAGDISRGGRGSWCAPSRSCPTRPAPSDGR